MTTNDDGLTRQDTGLLTVATVRTWVVHAMDLLTAARPVIDEANVFPVADSDTGTNLCLTLGDGRDALDALGPGVGLAEALHALARGALLGARGNSGIILSEYLRGFARGITGGAGARPQTDPAAAIADALGEASRCAYAAVGHPREGTMLTAAAGAAEAAAAAVRTAAPGGLREVVDQARAGAHSALVRSVDELDVLRTANVLDAGAYGLVLILDALGLAVAEAEMSGGAGMITIMDSLAVADPGADPGALPRADPGAHPGHGPHTAIDGEFEVMFVVEHAATDAAEIEAVGAMLRERLLQVGSSVVVVGGVDEPGGRAAATGTWQVHVHTDVPLDALRAAQDWTQRQVVVRALPNQVAARAHGAEPAHGVVACISSPGLVTDLARSGAVVVLRASVPVGREDLRRGALETGAAQVLVLPADLDSAAHARALADEGGSPALVVAQTVSDLHVVAAVSAWVSTPQAAGDDHAALEPVTAVLEPLAAVRAAVAQVRTATSDGRDLPDLLDQLGRLLDGVRTAADAVLTVLVGDLVSAQVVSALTAEAARRCPGIEVVVLASGVRSQVLVMGVDEL